MSKQIKLITTSIIAIFATLSFNVFADDHFGGHHGDTHKKAGMYHHHNEKNNGVSDDTLGQNNTM